ncbi:MAG: hypothetical protein ACK4UN_08720 [Limisphaerales bacterium]
MDNEAIAAVKKFFSPKEEVIKHWYTPLDNFQFATPEFYGMIEKELQARKVPGLEISRVEFSEGGLLSDKREYLRLRRERLVFDICAAPFGTSYFFSFRFVELPLGIKPLELLIFFIGLGITFGILAQVFGTFTGFLLFLMLLVSGIWFLRNVISLGLKDLDATLLKTPVIGPIYEIFFRKETYYRQDTRLMYLTTVDTITKTLVDEVTAAKGIKLVKRYERRPIMGELYQEKTNVGGEPPLEKAA